MVETRNLTSAERDLVVSLLSARPFAGAAELIEQIPNTRVVGGTPTFLDLEVRESESRSSVPDGPIPVRAFVEGANSYIEGEILVWVTAGYLAGIEFAWFTDEPPRGLPPAERIRVEAPGS